MACFQLISLVCICRSLCLTCRLLLIAESTHCFRVYLMPVLSCEMPKKGQHTAMINKKYLLLIA